MFIYKITHIPSKRFYIGRTIQKLKYRFNQHKKKSSNYILRSLLNKYPIEQFCFESIFEIKGDKTKENQRKLINKEQEYLNKYFDDELCINFDKNARPLYAEDFINRKIQREKRKSRIKKLSSIKATIPHTHKKNRIKKSYSFKDETDYIGNAKKASLYYHANKTPEQEKKRRDNVRKAMVAKLKPINMFDLNNNFIGTYESKRHIIRCYPELHRRGIQKVLTGEYSQHKGYTFKYKT